MTHNKETNTQEPRTKDTHKMNEEDEEQRKPIMFKKQNQPTQNKHNHKKFPKTQENIKDKEKQ